MNETLQQLEAWGCNIQGALPRFLDDEAFMLECIVQVSEDPAFETLGDFLAKNKVKQAFDSAHTLKGILANTGLTPLYETIVQIVEPLRTGSAQGLMPQYTKLLNTRRDLIDLLNRSPEENCPA